MLSSIRFPHRQAQVVAVDHRSTAYLCGASRLGGTECLAIQPGQDEPAWLLQLPEGDNISGGALIDRRLYVTLENGLLYAIDDASP